MKAPQRYRPEEDAAICAAYSSKTLAAIAADLGRDYRSVAWRVRWLVEQGRLDPADRRCNRTWTQDEIDWLSDNWGLLPDAKVAAHLGRTITACIIAAKRKAEVNRKMSFYTARNVADVFGVDVHLVAKWIAAGCLKARKSPVRCGDGHIMWRIDDEAITAFVRKYPYHYERRRMEVGSWWRNLADKVWQADPWLTIPQAAKTLGVNPETVRRHIRRGWLVGVKTWEAGKSGGYRIAQSQLAHFRYHHEPVPASPALQAWYDRERA